MHASASDFFLSSRRKPVPLFIGGVALDLTDRLNASYNVAGGKFRDNPVDGAPIDGYIHSIVAEYDIRCDLMYAMQTSLVDLNDGAASAVGITNYLFKTVNDCTSLGARFEWLNSDGLATNGVNEDLVGRDPGHHGIDQINFI